MITLFLCERPAHARRIASVLHAEQRQDGYIRGEDVIITWTFGQILSLAEPEDYDKRFKGSMLANLPIVPDDWRWKVKKGAGKQFNVIKTLLKQADKVCIAMTPDAEGEYIAWGLLTYCYWDGEVERLWSRSLDDQSLRQALARREPCERASTLYQASLANAKVNWLFSANFSRLSNLLATQKGQKPIIIDHLQLAALKLVATRYQTAQSQSDKTEQVLRSTLHFADNVLPAQWQLEDSNVPSDLNQLAADIVSSEHMIVVKSETQTLHEAPPPLFSLALLQKACFDYYGMSAQDVSHAVLMLYETHQLITYPWMSPLVVIPDEVQEAQTILSALVVQDERLKQLIDGIVVDDEIVIAPYAILPTACEIKLDVLSVKQYQVYDLVRRGYIAQFYSQSTYVEQLLQIKVDDVLLSTTISTFSEDGLGWRQAYAFDNHINQCAPVSYVEGDQLVLTDVVLAQNNVNSLFYTEAQLLAEMYHVGLGLFTTKNEAILALLRQGLLHKDKKLLKLTPKGNALLTKLPEDLSNIELAVANEQQLAKIVAAEITCDDVVYDHIDWIEDEIAIIKAQQVQHDSIKRQSNVVNQVVDEYICPACAKPLIRRKGKTGFFWGCSAFPGCRTTLPDKGGKPGQPRSNEYKSQSSHNKQAHNKKQKQSNHRRRTNKAAV